MINIIFLSIITILIIIIIIQNKKINYISNTLRQVNGGNLNQRIRMQNHNKSIKGLVENLNNLINEFQKTLTQNRSYEEERKKMISNISHDLRTPLTSLLGYVEVIKNTKTLSDEEYNEYLNIIEKKGTSLKDLMDKFFQLSKLDSNDVKLEIKSINIYELIRQNIVLFFNDFIQLDIEPIINIPDKDIYVLADESAVNRILNNLISNSLKYGSEGKHIEIAAKENKNHVAIEVSDKGKGIPKNELPYIFERLYTLEKSRNSKLQGSGLGLTIVKKLVEKQKGELKVTSVPYEKTSFSFTLPKDLRNL